MKKLEHLREKAVWFRTKHQMPLPEICERLNVSKTTAWHWIKDLPKIGVTGGQRKSAVAAGRVVKKNAKKKRDEAYAEGKACVEELMKDPKFRDFVVLYLAEGYKKCRNKVAICNSDPTVLVLSHAYMKTFARNKLFYTLQYHDDQDIEKLKDFWGKTMNVDPEIIRLTRKTNSGNMKGRNWNCKYGVLTVGSCDTYFRSKLEAWMDHLREQWMSQSIVSVI